MKTDFIEELSWRRMLHDHMPGTREMLAEGPVKGYIGFDPTSDSLHVGNLVQIMTLLHFQRAGHIPVALVGGATGMVGDPSGKSAERNLLDEATLFHNVSCIQKQLEKFLDFTTGPNKASIVNNYDWFKGMPFLSFIRDVGKHITINYMLSKDSVQNRLEGGMSFTEFSYQLVQGYDFYWLWKNEQIRVQMGGSDQWGNIVTGTELIRRKGQGEAFAVTTQLIKKADGTKFGKTESGTIWLDAAKTSPYHYYQFWLNASDHDASNYIRIFTLLNKEEIEALEAEHLKAPHLRTLQLALAADVTTRTHGVEALNQAREASQILFGSGTSDALRKMSGEMILQVFEGVPVFKVGKSVFESGVTLVDFLAVHTSVMSSKGEARKMIESGAVMLNKEKSSDINRLIGLDDLLDNRFLIVQKGKKNYFLVMVQ